MLDKELQITRRQLAWRMIVSIAIFALGFAILGIFAEPVGASALYQESPATDATVNVAHYAPFGDSQDGTSVSVYVDGAEAIPDFKFGDVINDVSLSPGEHLIGGAVSGPEDDRLRAEGAVAYHTIPRGPHFDDPQANAGSVAAGHERVQMDGYQLADRQYVVADQFR